jgi:hypothetical protein
MAKAGGDMEQLAGRRLARAVALSGKTGTAGQLRSLAESARTEKQALALQVLLSARALVSLGWSPLADARSHSVDSLGRKRWSLLGAILASQQTQFGWEQELARSALREVLSVYSLADWERQPGRSLSDVLHFVDRAIRALGGKPPRRGGWTVSERSSNQEVAQWKRLEDF